MADALRYMRPIPYRGRFNGQCKLNTLLKYYGQCFFIRCNIDQTYFQGKIVPVTNLATCECVSHC